MFALSFLSRKARTASGAILAAALGLTAYYVNQPEPPPPREKLTFPIDPTIENVTFERPAGKVPGDRGDIRVAYAPMIVPMSKQTEPSPFHFAEIAVESGIDFVHVSGMTEEKHYPSANGSGVALFDFDNDGRLDIYFCSATYLPLGTSTDGKNRLYRNLGENRFQDVTDASGLGFHGFCHGVVVGDVDNDGDQDVFLCNYGPNVLYRNEGNGTFVDVSRPAGVDRASWSSGGAFLDYDDDGDLDLYVANYGEWKYPEDSLHCGDANRGARIYCSPSKIRPVRHFLYRNNGDGTFTDVYEKAIGDGHARADGRGFGVVTADINGDGKIDIFVANDMSPNFVFLNRGDGTFEDGTETSGAGFDKRGNMQSAMGADAEDIDGDGRPELIISNFEGQYNTFYQNLGEGRFTDVTQEFGLGKDTIPWVGWGIALADFDNDGWPDNFVANGHVDDNLRLLSRNVDEEEPALLFANVAGKRFRLATYKAGPYFETRHFGRGAAFGDIDNDGDVDIVVNHRGTRPAVLRNDTPNDNAWLRLEFEGTLSNRDGVGTRVELIVGDRTIHRQRKGNYSIESANDPRLLIGLGPAREVTRLVARWPSGAELTLEHLQVNRTYHLTEPKARTDQERK